ncbi:membrane protein [Streptomyces showdoensis]|uniref:Membrane protein n=1 Tax=Streptomyces showdoensis TaxID=68268 RepID=A0A2P2GMB6_STREW|nr:membrane protein [Streptomyces showdoensis]
MTDTRGQGPSYETYNGPLPGERAGGQPQQGGPYHPPQAYGAPAQGGTAGGQNTAAVRKPRTGARTTPRTRKARLRVAKADPWSVMKVSFLLSIALGICTVVAASVLWMVMDAMGVFSTVGGTISEATGSNESNGFDLQSFLSLPRVLMFTSIIAVIDVVLMTALATLGAFIYNLSAGFVGGVELTLAEDE